MQLTLVGVCPEDRLGVKIEFSSCERMNDEILEWVCL